jgi:hypothetical protein
MTSPRHFVDVELTISARRQLHNTIGVREQELMSS